MLNPAGHLTARPPPPRTIRLHHHTPHTTHQHGVEPLATCRMPPQPVAARGSPQAARALPAHRASAARPPRVHAPHRRRQLPAEAAPPQISPASSLTPATSVPRRRSRRARLAAASAGAARPPRDAAARPPRRARRRRQLPAEAARAVLLQVAPLLLQQPAAPSPVCNELSSTVRVGIEQGELHGRAPSLACRSRRGAAKCNAARVRSRQAATSA